MTAGYSIALFAQHAEMLAASGIPSARATARGYVTVDTKKRLADLGITKAGQNVPGLLIPQHRKDGSVWGYQYRPDLPRERDGKPVKYETPIGQANGIDVPPGVGPMLGDPAVPLWITEGVKKADSAAERGLACIALAGVWSWRGTNSRGGKVAVADWHDIALNGRRVILAFDSDVSMKPSVRSALDGLAKYVTSKGADVEYAHLPDDGDGKTGLDDYLLGHDVEELWGLVRPDPPVMGEPLLTTPSNDRATVQPQPPKLASAPRILDLLARAAVALGVVGEETVVATTYLVATSRLLDKQASLAVKGHSASGKSHAVAAVLRLFPDEALVVFTAMSSLALVYSTDEYAHRTIVIYEASALREGSEDNQTAYLLRSLLSEGRLDYEVTIKGKDGGFTTKRIRKNGPTNLILTTTKVRIHGENETRMLSVTTDDSRAQTGRVLAALADESERHVDVSEWQNLQQWLAGCDNRVTVPYAGRLAQLIPPVAVRLRRDFNTLLALIRAHAVLHQLNRARDEDGRIIATLEDYEIVSGIVAAVLAEGVASTVSPTVRQTVETVQSLDRAEGVASTVVAEHLELDKSAAHRRLAAAAAGGYVQNLEERRGRPGRWRPGAPLPDDVALLPSVARLRQVAEPVAPGGDHETQQTSDTDATGCTVARVIAPVVRDQADDGPLRRGVATCHHAGCAAPTIQSQRERGFGTPAKWCTEHHPEIRAAS